MGQPSTRQARQARPALEGLEQRNLLNARTIGPNGREINDKDLARLHVQLKNLQNGVTLADRRIEYTTPQGTHVRLTLYGIGSMAGTTIDPDAPSTWSSTAPTTPRSSWAMSAAAPADLRSVRHAGVPFDDYSGVGGTVLQSLKLYRSTSSPAARST